MSHPHRRFATGLNAALVLLFGLATLVLTLGLAEEHRVRFDLSEGSQATLSPQMVAALARVEERGWTLRVTAFSAQKRDGLARVRDRQMADFLAHLERQSSAVETSLVDLDRERLTAERMGVDRYGQLVVEADGRRVDRADRVLFRRSGSGEGATVTFVGEGAVLSAIQQLLARNRRVIYALRGHGEKIPFDRGRGDLRQLAEVQTELGVSQDTLDLLERPRAEGPAVPKDASAVLVLGPMAPMPEVEERALRSYLQQGGSVAVWLEPDGVTPGFVEDSGVRLLAGTAMDERALFPRQDQPRLVSRRHPLTSEFGDGALAVVANAAGGLESTPVSGVSGAPVLSTTELGWLERDPSRPAQFDEGLDGAGPVVVAWAADHVVPGEADLDGAGRLLVVADLDLVEDTLMVQGPGNRAFASAALRWLLREDASVPAAATPRSMRPLSLTADTLTWVRIGLVGGWPLVLLSAGFALRIWRARAS